jgi:hypothetical protein
MKKNCERRIIGLERVKKNQTEKGEENQRYRKEGNGKKKRKEREKRKLNGKKKRPEKAREFETIKEGYKRKRDNYTQS